MKSWQLVVILIVILGATATDMWLARHRHLEVMAELRPQIAEERKFAAQRFQILKESVDRRAEELRKLVNASESNAVNAVNARVAELDASVAGKIDAASAQTAAGLSKRMDTLEALVDKKLSALTTAPRPVAPVPSPEPPAIAPKTTK